jgi:hypothetical protein
VCKFDDHTKESGQIFSVGSQVCSIELPLILLRLLNFTSLKKNLENIPNSFFIHEDITFHQQFLLWAQILQLAPHGYKMNECGGLPQET